jgi:hypothetical protein
MATWPSTLPVPSYDGYALDPVDPVIRTDMEVGSGRSRRRTKARNDKINVTWRLTDAEMATFRTWFDDDAQAAGGSAWFTTTLATGATGLDSVEARFSGMWKGSLSGGMNWTITATLEVR